VANRPRRDTVCIASIPGPSESMAVKTSLDFLKSSSVCEVSSELPRFGFVSPPAKRPEPAQSIPFFFQVSK
jgi:hypothetical protein